MTYEIREATADDAPVVLALTQELAASEHLEKEVHMTVGRLARALSGPLPFVHASLLEVPEDGVVAHALWFPTFSTFLGRAGIWLEDLYVREPHRGKGYARALLEHLRNRTDGRVEWEVLDWNERAIAAYERVGARPVRGWTRYRWTPRD